MSESKIHKINGTDMAHVTQVIGIYRQIAVVVACHMIGSTYRWDDRNSSTGLDCSGLIVELLKSAGVLPLDGSWTASELADRYAHYAVQTVHEGCLLFWGADQKIRHVEFAISPFHSLGALGDGGSTVRISEAISSSSFVRVRPIVGRTDDLILIVDPFLSLKDQILQFRN
jgi:cell wall-associated NlpC family hydrolase